MAKTMAVASPNLARPMASVRALRRGLDDFRSHLSSLEMLQLTRRAEARLDRRWEAPGSHPKPYFARNASCDKAFQQKQVRQLNRLHGRSREPPDDFRGLREQR